MQTLDFRYAPAIDAAARAELARLAAALERRFPGHPAPILLPWSDQPSVVDDRGAPYLYGPVHTDPQLGDRAVLPRRQRRDLLRIATTDPQLDAIGVIHELDPDGPGTALLPQLADGPRTCSEAVARELVGPIPPHPGVTRTVEALAALLRRDAAARAARTLDRLLDPVVCGVVAPWPLDHGVPSLWQPLVAWRW
jgi:hypothetical protein